MQRASFGWVRYSAPDLVWRHSLQWSLWESSRGIDLTALKQLAVKNKTASDCSCGDLIFTGVIKADALCTQSSELSQRITQIEHVCAQAGLSIRGTSSQHSCHVTNIVVVKNFCIFTEK